MCCEESKRKHCQVVFENNKGCRPVQVYVPIWKIFLRSCVKRQTMSRRETFYAYLRTRFMENSAKILFLPNKVKRHKSVESALSSFVN